jgi:hypothetical protein
VPSAPGINPRHEEPQAQRSCTDECGQVDPGRQLGEGPWREDAVRSAAAQGARLARVAGDGYSHAMMLLNQGFAALMSGDRREAGQWLAAGCGSPASSTTGWPRAT